jgi:hypothetical protein
MNYSNKTEIQIGGEVVKSVSGDISFSSPISEEKPFLVIEIPLKRKELIKHLNLTKQELEELLNEK